MARRVRRTNAVEVVATADGVAPDTVEAATTADGDTRRGGGSCGSWMEAPRRGGVSRQAYLGATA